MEYAILGVQENTGIESAEKALKKIQLQCHANNYYASENEKKLAATLLEIATESFARIKQKEYVNDCLSLSIRHLTDRLTQPNNMQSFHPCSSFDSKKEQESENS